MKSRILASIFFCSIVSCTAPFTAPSPTPLATNTIAPAVAPTLAVLSTIAATPAPTAAVQAITPTVRDRVNLLDLPGIGRNPQALAVLGDKLYVVDNQTDNVAIIQNNRVTKFLPVGKSPIAIAVDASQKRLYVANRDDKTISLIGNDQVTLTTSIGETPAAILFSENRLWVGLDSKGAIYVLDPVTLKTVETITIPGAFSIINLAQDVAHHRIYAALYNKIGVIDTTNLKVQAIHAVDGSYYTLVANPQSDSILTEVYDSSANATFLISIDPISGKARSRVQIGGDPRDAVVSSDGARAFVANSYSNDVSVIDLRTMTAAATIPVDLEPTGLALDENSKRLYVANWSSHNVSVINTDTNQFMAEIPLAALPTAMAVNESTGQVYVANASSDSILVVEGARVVKEIPVGRHPIDLARDEKSNRVFVANASDRTLSIINESNFSIRATQPITRSLDTVAVDSAHSRLFAGDVILDLASLLPTGRLTMSGATIGSVIPPGLVRINSNTGRIYANGGNGTPGSNGRYVTYSIDGSTLKQRGIGMGYYGNTSAFEIDPENNRVYLAGTHPLALTNDLTVFDANDTRLVSLPLPARTTGMAYNPTTHHLFLAHTNSYSRGYGQPNPSADNTVQILDTTTFGQVALIDMPNSPGKMARLGNLIYVATLDNNSITLIEDAATPAPPTPTLTPTPTLYPTSTRTPIPTPRTATPVSRQPALPSCAIKVSTFASDDWTPVVAARIGCPTQAERAAQFGIQPYERGTMFYRDDEKRIYILFNDLTWLAVDDAWGSSAPTDSCPSITVGSGLVKPQRGFGKVWCEQPTVRAKLGTATATERGLYSAQTQRFERGQMFAGEQASQVFVLYADGKWE